MPESKRDTHFAGFAKQLVAEIEDAGLIPVHPRSLPIIRPIMEEIIARRAYDLVEYALIHHAYWTTGATSLKTAKMRVVNWEFVKRIPDMTAWPEQEAREQ